MTSRERVVRALTHQSLDRLPRDPWALPGVTLFRRAEYDALLRDFPSDFDGPGVGYDYSRTCRSGQESVKGRYVDAWNCEWEVKQDGVIGEVKKPPLANDYEGLDSFQPPWVLLDGMEEKRAQIALHCASSDKFIHAGGEIRPFERMQFLRGSENLYCDLALDAPESYVLRDKLHEFFLAEMRFWASTPVDGISFMDDWGSQKALLISPKKWRSFFKPLYKEYCEIAHAAGKFVFFHSDGFIEDIYPDLIEIGVDAVNSQLFCMDMERVGRDYGGKIAFNGELDRQHILPFGTEDEVRAAVRRQFKALCPDGKLTGCFAQCEWGVRDPEKNIRAVYDEWDKIAREQ